MNTQKNIEMLLQVYSDRRKERKEKNSPGAHVRLQLFGIQRPEVVNLMSPTWRQTSRERR